MAEVQQAPAAAAAAAPGPIVIDTQHDDMVHDSQLDYYSTKLATASSGTSSSLLYTSGCVIFVSFGPRCVWSVRCIVRIPDARGSNVDLSLRRKVLRLLSVVFDMYL